MREEKFPSGQKKENEEKEKVYQAKNPRMVSGMLSPIVMKVLQEQPVK